MAKVFLTYIIPKWQNFAKSGHTAVTPVLFHEQEEVVVGRVRFAWANIGNLQEAENDTIRRALTRRTSYGMQIKDPHVCRYVGRSEGEYETHYQE